jgi:hypothetical protein
MYRLELGLRDIGTLERYRYIPPSQKRSEKCNSGSGYLLEKVESHYLLFASVPASDVLDTGVPRRPKDFTG